MLGSGAPSQSRATLTSAKRRPVCHDSDTRPPETCILPSEANRKKEQGREAQHRARAPSQPPNTTYLKKGANLIGSPGQRFVHSLPLLPSTHIPLYRRGAKWEALERL